MSSGRIMGIDYGRKRIGIAVSDPTGTIANGLKTVSPDEFWTFLDDYLTREIVVRFVVGYPRKMNYEPSEAVVYINPFIRKLEKKYSPIPVDLADERFTSKIAVQSMIEGGLKKKARQNKALVDTISAAIILQSYLDRKANINERDKE
jgi:putative Holliday junction resolvase